MKVLKAQSVYFVYMPFFLKESQLPLFKLVHFNRASILLSFEPELNDQTTYLMTNTFTGSTVIRKKNQGKENSVENVTFSWFLMH